MTEDANESDVFLKQPESEEDKGESNTKGICFRVYNSNRLKSILKE